MGEPQRLAALHRAGVLDTPREQLFDDITSLASVICGTPIALMTLVDEQRQWFKSSVGLEIAETSRDIAFCHYTIQRDEVMIVTDATRDERFATNPLVVGDPEIRFYAGAPLRTAEDERIGTICVIDRTPRHLDEQQIDALRDLARHASSLLTLRTNERQLQRSRTLLQSVLDNAPTVISIKDLDGRYVLVNEAPLHDDDGLPFGTGGIAADLAEQLQAEQRAAELQRRFEQAKRLEGLGQLAGGVAHDFNNLLAVIIGATGFAEDAVSGDGIEVTLQRDAAPCWVEADRSQLEQVLLNLAINARDAMPEGGALTIRTERLILPPDGEPPAEGATPELAGEIVALTVHDQGTGMTPDVAARAFEPFFSTKAQGRGTGLGLSTVHGAIAKAGGTVHLETAPGRGTTVVVRLQRGGRPGPLAPDRRRPGPRHHRRHARWPLRGRAGAGAPRRAADPAGPARLRLPGAR